MIEVKGLTKRYGRKTAVEDLSFTLEKGCIYGFLGPNGAGKSTTMNILTGYLAANDGSVIINGFDILKDPIKAKKNIGYLPEIPPVYPDMTVREYLYFAGELKGIARKDRKSAGEDVMEKTGIADVSERLIRNLSKGYKQRVGLAQAILGYPDVIILDEPTVGLDPKQIIEIRELIKSLRSEHTIVLSSHILQEISAVCDHIMIISNGKLVASDKAENIQKSMKGLQRISLCVKGSQDEVSGIIAGIEGAGDPEISAAGQEGRVSVTISAPPDKDLREDIFYAFAKASCPILEMTSSSESLEDIYLKLTGSDETDSVMDTKTEEETEEKTEETEEKKEEKEEEEVKEEVKGGDEE